MPEFTQDWSKARSYWPDMFADLGLPGKPRLRFLEIGCYEGMATLWLLENVLTGEGSSIDVVDTFEGSPEFGVLGVDAPTVDRFKGNLAGHLDRVTIRKGPSGRVLRVQLPPEPMFDFVYVDGSHRAADVLEDAVLAWPMLKPGGVMVFDDYGWTYPGATVWDRPRLGVNAFVRAYENQLVERLDAYQYAVEKAAA